MNEQAPRRVRRTEEELTADLPALVDVVADGSIRVVIAREGRPVAALISAHDLVRLQAAEEQIQRDLVRLEQIQQEFAEAFKDRSAAEQERVIARALAEARAELRAEREAAAQAARTA